MSNASKAKLSGFDLDEGYKMGTYTSRDQQRIAELERRLEVAKEDTARLDWLEKYPDANEPMIVYHLPSDLITWRIKSDEPGVEYKTLREAIDAARKERG